MSWHLSDCVIQSVCHSPINDLACHMSSHSLLVEHPTNVRKVMGLIPIWSSFFFRVFCLRIIVYKLYVIYLLIAIYY